MEFHSLHRTVGLVGALVATGWPAAVGKAAQAASDPATTMAGIARELGLQTRMPGPEPVETEPSSLTHWHIPGSLAEWMLWGALAVGLAFALHALRDTLPGRRPRTAARTPGAVILASQAAVQRMAEAADDADELARGGRFAEAMHVLLLHSLAEMRRRLDVTIADSLTSREILRRLSLPKTGRGALADLIARVEPVYFGTKPAAPDDYSACRANFEALIGAMQAQTAIAA